MRTSLVVAAAAATLLGTPFLVAPATAAPVTAAASVCPVDGGDPDPYTAKATRATASVTTADGRTISVELRSGNNAAAQQHAWVKISSSTPLRATDQVWLEVTGDSGATWATCGVTSPVAGSLSAWTHGFRTSTSAQVRMVGAVRVVQTPTDLVGRTGTW
ncbi:hypothetical protein L6E12_22925 [Actinokineospora sp. PR83]|uniref:hypothetical protein n=1 Tax=Actinokineospora sp. PR83 TaxID=2884908 RepID=UPI001F3BAD57|nr:hypothetical protein [Actinokineospora sp. PR83]MCG8918640.1 hypothetical protein [Actinokineospora sp. PR83]